MQSLKAGGISQVSAGDTRMATAFALGSSLRLAWGSASASHAPSHLLVSIDVDR